MADYLMHHGILGQKWGDRNGPPYPLGGGDYSPRERTKIFRERKKKNSIYNKKHFDKVIKKGTNIATLSYDPNRTKDTDMFYGAYDKLDKHQYNALFNKKVPQDIYDENGEKIGTGEFYKFRINNATTKDVKVASEDSGATAFIDLYSSNRDFSNFVRDPKRMQSLFVEDKYKFRGYREAASALDRIRSTDKPSEKDLRTAYRMFNYVIPSSGIDGVKSSAGDVLKQRTRLFNQLEKNGYDALLDTNDSIYGGFKTNAPVIVFNMQSITFKNANRVTVTDKAVSNAAFVGKKFLGL